MTKKIVAVVLAALSLLFIMPFCAGAYDYADITNVVIASDYTVTFDKFNGSAFYDVKVFSGENSVFSLKVNAPTSARVTIPASTVKKAFTDLIAQQNLTGVQSFDIQVNAYDSEKKIADSEFITVKADASNPSGVAVVLDKISFKFATAAHGMSLEQIKKLLTVENDTAKVEWKKVFENKNNKDFKKKLYAGNEYDATIIVDGNGSFCADKDTEISISGASIVKKEYNEADGTVTLVIRFKASGNFFQKIVTFFHNLFY